MAMTTRFDAAMDRFCAARSWIRTHKNDLLAGVDLAASAALGATLGEPLGIQLAVLGGIGKEIVAPTASRHLTLKSRPLHPLDRAIRGIFAYGITSGAAYELSSLFSGVVGQPAAALIGGAVATAAMFGLYKAADSIRRAPDDQARPSSDHPGIPMQDRQPAEG